jgi:hypothetical protein
MPLPTKEDVLAYSYSLDGSPWVKVGTTVDVDTTIYEYSLDGSPWFGTEIPRGPLDMDLGMFKIYDRVLTDQEVYQNYSAFRGRYNI